MIAKFSVCSAFSAVLAREPDRAAAHNQKLNSADTRSRSAHHQHAEDHAAAAAEMPQSNHTGVPV
jgi:hypothetical protein